MATPVVCPTDSTWLRRMLEVLPPGLRGKLEAYSPCLSAPGRRRHVNHGGGGRRRNGRRGGERSTRVMRPVVR